MQLSIKKMVLDNFMGIKHMEIDTSMKTDITGKNGVGKSTIATAHYWLWSGKSYSLVDNPEVAPIGVEEATPTVTEIISVDGKTITVVKLQKRKVSKPDIYGVRKVSTTNSYLINDVPKSERDFKAYFTDLGVDFEKFLMLSHPSVFTGGMSDKKSRTEMRNLLFSMAKNVTDFEIVKKYAAEYNLFDIERLLANYSVEEITAMQNATVRKVKENYGKDGEILRATIDGLERGKAEFDEEALNKEKEELLLKLDFYRIEESKATDNAQQIGGLYSQITVLENKKEHIISKANFDNDLKKRELTAKYERGQDKISSLERTKSNIKAQIKNAKTQIENNNKMFESLKASFESLKEKKYSGDNTCPYCKQMLPKSQIDGLVSAFEQKQTEEKERINKHALDIKKSIKNSEKILTGLEADLEGTENLIKETTAEISNIGKELKKLPDKIEVSDSSVKDIDKQISKLNGQIEELKKFKSADTSDSYVINQRLKQIEVELSKKEFNEKIDIQIEKCKEEQIAYEQAKATAEKILDQLSRLSKLKNEMLTDEINKHFKLVKWQLFDYQKNGTYIDVCVPTIDGFRFGTSANTGREELAKVDIISGLQSFFGQIFPIFLDGAECLDSNTKSRIDIDTQIIYLTVAETALEVH